MPIIYILIIAATVVGIVNWKYLKTTREWIFLPFLCFTIIVEIIGNYYAWVEKIQAPFLYDFYTLIAMLFAIYWFYCYLRYKTLAIVSSITILLSYLIGVYYVEEYTYEIPALVIAAALIITINVFVFFNRMLKKDHLNKFKIHRPFWIAIGLFVFHINAMPFALFLPHLNRLTWQVSGVLVFINLIMYGCFIHALNLKNHINE